MEVRYVIVRCDAARKRTQEVRIVGSLLRGQEYDGEGGGGDGGDTGGEEAEEEEPPAAETN